MVFNYKNGTIKQTIANAIHTNPIFIVKTDSLRVRTSGIINAAPNEARKHPKISSMFKKLKE
jgi:hypothetical protein